MVFDVSLFFFFPSQIGWMNQDVKILSSLTIHIVVCLESLVVYFDHVHSHPYLLWGSWNLHSPHTFFESDLEYYFLLCKGSVNIACTWQISRVSYLVWVKKSFQNAVASYSCMCLLSAWAIYFLLFWWFLLIESHFRKIIVLRFKF